MYRWQFLNVLFCNNIHPHVVSKGKSLYKDKLTEGLKTDEKLHELIATEYNNGTNLEHS